MTANGLEGGGVYALSAKLRETIAAEGAATLVIDFKPDIGEAALAARLVRKPGQSISTWLRKGGRAGAGRDRAHARSGSAARRRRGACPTDQALANSASSAPRRSRARSRPPAAIAWSEIDEDFMLRQSPGRVRRRRDDRLGGADRRLSLAGLLLHRLGGGPRGGALGGRDRQNKALAPLPLRLRRAAGARPSRARR